MIIRCIQPAPTPTIRLLMAEVRHLTMAELHAGLEAIRQAPKDHGVLELIVRRPQRDAREVLAEGKLDLSKASWATVGERAAVPRRRTGQLIRTCSSTS